MEKRKSDSSKDPTTKKRKTNTLDAFLGLKPKITETVIVVDKKHDPNGNAASLK